MEPPPAYEASLPAWGNGGAAELAHGHSELGLASGYFILRNKANGKSLDVGQKGDSIHLSNTKQPRIVRDSDNLESPMNSQVFYLSWNGEVFSAAQPGQALDVIDHRLVLTTPRPIYQIPSRNAHPHPQLQYDPITQTLAVLFKVDPSYPGPSSGSREWLALDYLLESVAQPSKTAGLETGSFLTGLGGRIGGGIGGWWNKGGEGVSPPAPGGGSSGSNGTTRTSPVPQVNRALPPLPPEDDDSDGDDSPQRAVRLLALDQSWREKFPFEVLGQTGPESRSRMSSANGAAGGLGSKHVRTWRRRQWECIPVVIRAVDPTKASMPVPTLPRSLQSLVDSALAVKDAAPGMIRTSSQALPDTTRSFSRTAAPKALQLAPSKPSTLNGPHSANTTDGRPRSFLSSGQRSPSATSGGSDRSREREPRQRQSTSSVSDGNNRLSVGSAAGYFSPSVNGGGGGASGGRSVSGAGARMSYISTPAPNHAVLTSPPTSSPAMFGASTSDKPTPPHPQEADEEDDDDGEGDATILMDSDISAELDKVDLATDAEDTEEEERPPLTLPSVPDDTPEEKGKEKERVLEAA